MQLTNQEPQTDGLRIASNIRFVFTKKNHETRVSEIKKPKEDARRGRRGTRTTTADAEGSGDARGTKQEWGRAFKHMTDGKEAVFDIFLLISQAGECATDPFYRKIFREMAYGTFPKGVFYDKHRDCLVCTEMNGKKKSVYRKAKIEKFMQICMPERLCKTFEMEIELREGGTRDTESDVGDGMDMQLKALKCIYRSSQRLELPVEILNTKYGLTYDQIYREIKLFFYIVTDTLSPWDANLLKDENFRCIQTQKDVVPTKSWKKLTQIEQISFMYQYCRGEFYRIYQRQLDKLSPSQERLFKRIKTYLCSLVLIGFIPPTAVVYTTRIEKIHGVTITSQGVNIDEGEIEGFRERKTADQDLKIGSVVIQKIKNVDLQKISNGVSKQAQKTSKMIRVITETDNRDD